MDIREKIRKLLALGTSANEFEARDALLKARELMARNKLSEADFEDRGSMELVHLECKAASWTSDSGNIWMTKLCDLLCDNYCCAAAWQHAKGHRTYMLIITGMRDDAELCKTVVEYAVDFVVKETKVLKKLYSNDYRSMTQSYASGFISGLEMALEIQKEEHAEWGLVMVKPEEVNEYTKSLGSKSVKTKKSSFNPYAYMKGQNDGKNFDTHRVLGETG